MKRKQYLLLCALKRRVREANAVERKLRNQQRNTKRPYDWAAWRAAEGYASGLTSGLIVLEQFIKEGKRRVP